MGEQPGVEGHTVSWMCSSRCTCNCLQAEGLTHLATGYKLRVLFAVLIQCGDANPARKASSSLDNKGNCTNGSGCLWSWDSPMPGSVQKV